MSPATPTRPWRVHALSLLALLCFVGALYGRTVTFHFVDWDDRHHVYANPAVVAPETAAPLDLWLGRNIGYPLPLTLASWRLDRALYGPERLGQVTPAQGQGYHQTQLLFIALFGVALYALGCITLGSGWPALLFAALVLSHPVMAEPLAWITGRKDLFVGLFATLTLFALWRTRTPASGENRTRWWVLAALLATLAMASKPTGISVAAMVLWAATLGRPRSDRADAGGLGWRSWLAVALTCALAAVVLIVGSRWHQQVGGVVEAAAPATGSALRRGWRVASSAVVRSLHGTSWLLRMLTAPEWLRAKYVFPAPNGLGWGELGTALVGVATAFIALRWRTHLIGWAAALALLAWLPVSNLVPLRRHVADSYLLLPWLALCWAGVGQLGRVPRGPRALRARRAGIVVGFVLVALLSLRASSQIETWRDAPHLWQHTLRYQPRSPQVCRMAGHGLYFEGDKRGALAVWRGCAERFGPALFANNLAVTAVQIGERQEALRWLRWILARRPNDARALRYLRRLQDPDPPLDTRLQPRIGKGRGF